MKKVIYLDNAATTRCYKEVVKAMSSVHLESYGNPSSSHEMGEKAFELLMEGKRAISKEINCKPYEIIFTSGGTESNNFALRGLALANLEKKKIIISSIEHSSVYEECVYLKVKGYEIVELPVDREGLIDLEKLENEIDENTLLVSIIHANNEIGTIQDLKKISTLCKKNNVLFHADAVQSFGKTPIDVLDIELDFMSISSHKIYGSKGIGAIYIKDINQLSPIFYGGKQENKIKPGTENLPGIAGFGIAAKLISLEMYENAIKLRSMQIELMEKLLLLDDVTIIGAGIEKVKENLPEEKYLYRLPGHVSICCKYVEGENLVLQADLKGLAISSGSACSSLSTDIENAKIKPSHVLVALGVKDDYIKGSLRVSLGQENTSDDVSYIAESIKNILDKLRVRVA